VKIACAGRSCKIRAYWLEVNIRPFHLKEQITEFKGNPEINATDPTQIVAVQK
jgi:hypothetical protein